MGTVAAEAEEEGEIDDDEARDWAIPLLEDAFFRAKRLQENGERQAKRRKGDHYDEWRTGWVLNELPPLVEEIIAPALEAIYRANTNMTESEWDDQISVIARRSIATSKSVNDFTKTIAGEIGQ